MVQLGMLHKGPEQMSECQKICVEMMANIRIILIYIYIYIQYLDYIYIYTPVGADWNMTSILPFSWEYIVIPIDFQRGRYTTNEIENEYTR